MASTRILSIIGRKNAGKTTLTVALASELARRGRRVMTIKHSHHPADVDRAGTDSWRHFHEGRAERSVIAAPDVRVLFERAPDELRSGRRWRAATWPTPTSCSPKASSEAPIPKIEVFRPPRRRRRRSSTRLGPNAARWVGHGDRRSRLRGAAAQVIRFQDTMWLQLLATLDDRARPADRR